MSSGGRIDRPLSTSRSEVPLEEIFVFLGSTPGGWRGLLPRVPSGVLDSIAQSWTVLKALIPIDAPTPDPTKFDATWRAGRWAAPVEVWLSVVAGAKFRAR